MKAVPVQATVRQRSLSAFAALLIVAGGAAALLLGLRLDAPAVPPPRALEAVLPSRSTPAPSPSPSLAPVPSPASSATSAGGEAAPAGARAAAIVLPPLPPLLDPAPVPAALSPDAGAATSAGTAAGTGTGTGGTGSGTGGGGSGGNGEGDGRPDLSAYPRQTAGKLHYWEIPKDLRRARAGLIRLRYRIGIDGRVSGCTVIASSGLPAFDRETCARITERFRFRPARDRQGRPVAFVMTETHGWDYEPSAP